MLMEMAKSSEKKQGFLKQTGSFFKKRLFADRRKDKLRIFGFGDLFARLMSA